MSSDRRHDEDRSGGPDDLGSAGWMVAARAGDADALGRALEGCRDDLRRVAEADLGADLAAKVEASDLVQETFLAACRDFRGFQGTDRPTFLRWLRAIFRRRLADAAGRARGPTRRLDLEIHLDADSARADGAHRLADTGTSPSGRAARDEDRRAIRSAMECLPAHYRDAILWRYWERLEFDEIGDRLGVSGESARKFLARALARLREAIGGGHEVA